MTHAYETSDGRSWDFPEVSPLGEATEEDVGRLAFAQAVYKAVASEVGTRQEGNLRDRVNRRFLRLHEETGGTSFDIRLGGRKVGTFSFRRTKGTPAHKEARFVVSDRDALDDAFEASDDFERWLSRRIGAHLGELAVEYAEETGEMLPGVTAEVVEVPATPDGIQPSGSLRVDPAKVAEAMGDALPAAVAGLLGGGSDG